MGGQFSATEYAKQIKSFSDFQLSEQHEKELSLFLELSSDFLNVFSSSTLDDYRNIKRDKPQNLIYLISLAAKTMHDTAMIQDEIGFGTIKTRQCSGAIHLLTRIFPLVFEDKEFLTRSMWTEQEDFGKQINALYILDSLSILLFKPGFTIKPLPADAQPKNFGIDEHLVWKHGICVMETHNHSVTQYDQNRISLMHLIVAMLSQPMFNTPEEYLFILNPFATYLTNRRCKNVKNLYISLVNLVLSYDIHGYGIPYVSSIDLTGDTETMTTLALHILLILIEYKPPSLDNLRYLIKGGHPTMTRIFHHFCSKAPANSPEEQATLQEAILEDLTLNEHFRLLRVVHGKINFDPLYNGLSKYFTNTIDYQNSYLPNSSSQVPFHQEAFVYTWRLLTVNTQAFDDFTQRDDFCDKFLLGILLTLNQSKKNPTKSNLMYLCIFMLLTVSSSRELAMQFNNPLNSSCLKLFDLPFFDSGKCTYSDLIFCQIHKLIASGPRTLKPLYKQIVAVICNIAPYTKQLQRESCDGLIYLLQVFTKLEFLKEREDNCRTTTALFECINYLLAYNDSEQQHLQIQLMKYQHVFDMLESKEFEDQFKSVQPDQIINVQQMQQSKVEEEKAQDTAFNKQRSVVESISQGMEQNEVQDQNQPAETDVKEETKVNEVLAKVQQQVSEEKAVKSSEGSAKKADDTDDNHKQQQQEDEVQEQIQQVQKQYQEQEQEEQEQEQDSREKYQQQVPLEQSKSVPVPESAGFQDDDDDDDWKEYKDEAPDFEGGEDEPQPQQLAEEQKSQPQSAALPLHSESKQWPSHGWFLEWRTSLNLANIKICNSHTYNKAMAYRNNMIEQDPLSFASGNQIINIDEDYLAAYLKKYSLKGLLPNMPKILVTTYKGNQSIDTWLISYLWGLVFTFAQEFKIYEPRFFRLFTISAYHAGQQNQ